jgi:hypothetical protein
MDKIIFEPIRFVENLQYMGVGMLGVFLIVGIIIGARYAINYFSNKFTK